jgi:hypothetical protein
MSIAGLSTADPKPERRRFQYSLATLFIFVTGICVACSLVRWHATYGLMAAILIVAGGWSLAAMRAGYPRLAFPLATSAMGVAGYLALMPPMAFLLRGGIWDLWLHPGAVGLMSVSAILAAALLRGWILAPGQDVSIGKAIGGVYVTAGCFPLLWGLALMPMNPGAGILICIVGLILSPVFATLTLPLTLPLALFCCWLLRKLDSWRPGTG